MTRADDDARAVKAALDRLPVPAHRVGFWDELEDRLVGDVDRAGGGRARVRHRWLALAAAAVVLVGVLVAVVVLRDNGARHVDVTDQPTAPTTSTPVSGPSAADAGARHAAIAWIDALVAGDMKSAWDALGPASRDTWASFDAFAGARTDFAEGLATWASAQDRVVRSVTVGREGAASVHVVTFTGRRSLEGTPYDDAFAVVVRATAAGAFELEPFTPHDTIGLQFVRPARSEQPATWTRDAPLTIAVPNGTRDVAVVVDGVVHSLGKARTFVPDGGWTPGRHVVTAYAVYSDGTPAATAVVLMVR